MNARVVAIVGTYREGGITDQAVDVALEELERRGVLTKRIRLSEKRIEFCTNCRNCTQAAGARGKCMHDDDMEEIFLAIEEADGIVFASPMNFGQVTAVTKRFIERLLPYGYWPWGTAIPQDRLKPKTKRAILIISSTMPAIMARCLTGIRQTMKQAVETAGARVHGTLFIGMVGVDKHEELPEKWRSKARKLARGLL